ncbi:MAG: hypothetical protein KJN60_02855 [Boseongicola sp.]|nr:hypothetical protein [Boseongicola sp.]
MLRALTHISLVLSTIVLVASVSLGSTLDSAPDRQEIERAKFLQIYNTSLAALCLSDESEGGHECPLCHKLPEGPQLDPPGVKYRLAWMIDPKAGGDLVYWNTGYRYQTAPRAPPFSI